MNALISQINENLERVCIPGATYEVRALHTNQGTISGYFDDLHKMAAAAASLSGRAEGVYMTLNPVNPELLARASNRVKPYSKHTSADSDVTLLRWLMLDFDPVRPTGISATDDEKTEALATCLMAKERICQSWVELDYQMMDSGNGYHLLIGLNDLENTPMNVEVCQMMLANFADLYSNERVIVDRKTFNPARLTTLYGTLKMKGDSMEARPHRFSGWTGQS